ncbi:MAG TPA: SURF1 family cytochrome oxidase biogenesis protein [Motilibacterales bacterium]|nr:SURF1 family cytochrome oxidase biogenesis protein [Motilibacterales bacterium]
MLGILRQRRWLGFTAFILAMLVLCVILARWQWSRYQYRLDENDRLDAALAAPGVPVDELLEAVPAGSASLGLPQELEWRTVTATGTFDPAGETAVRRRPLDGRNGFWIVTPLVTESGVLLVNRGWAPAGRDATTAPDVPAAPLGLVTLTGRLRPAEATEPTDAPPPGQAWAADPQVLVVPADAPRFNAYADLTSSTPAADAELTSLPVPGHRGLNNLVYSVQWLLFGLVGIVGWWRLIRVEGRRSEESAEPTAASTAAAEEPAT